MSAARSLDKELESVIKRAARDPNYRELLREDRAAALAQSDLCPAVQSLVMSVKTENLEKMIHKELGKPDGPRTRWGCVGAGGLTLAGALLIGSTMTLGHTARVSDETHARHRLSQIVQMQQDHFERHGTYATFEMLQAAGYEHAAYAAQDRIYGFAIELEDGSYRVTATHRRRPGTRACYVVGPDGVVRELERDDAHLD